MDDAAKKLSLLPQDIHSPMILGEAATDIVVQSTQSGFIRRQDETITSVTMRQKTHEVSALLSGASSTSFDEPINPLSAKRKSRILSGIFSGWSLRGTSEQKTKEEEEEDDGGFLQCEALCQSSQSVAEASFKRWWFSNSDFVTKKVTACCRDAFIAQNGDFQCLEQHIQCYFRCLLDSKCNEFCGSLGRNLNANERTTLKDAVKNEIAAFCQCLKPNIVHQEGGSFWKNDALARVQKLQIINQIKLDLGGSGMMLAGLMKLLNENVSSILEKLIAQCMDEYLQYMDRNERMSTFLRRGLQVKSLIAFRSRNIQKMSEESMARIKKQIKDING